MHLFALALALIQATPTPSASPSPPLVVAPMRVDFAPGTSASLQVSGGTAPFVATLTPQIAGVTVTGAAITLSAGGQIGTATLHVADGAGNAVDLPVRVAFYAGAVPATFVLKVTGTVLDPLWLSQTVANDVRGHVAQQPGTALTVGSFALPAALPPGNAFSAAVPVHISGGDTYLDVDATANVVVQNVQVASFAPSVLFYDDDPENLNATGVTFRGRIDATHPTRLYYYHENGAVPKDLYVFVAPESASSTVHVIDSSAGPNIDVLTVGHAVTKNFLLRKPSNQGVILDLLPGGPPLERFSLQRLEGVAGNVDLRVMDGGPVDVTVLSVPAGSAPAAVARAASGPVLPDDTHHRTGIFSLDGYADDTVAFHVGGPDASLLYGAQSPPAAQANPDWHDSGEYGVLRHLTLEIDNPSGAPSVVYVYEQPEGGVIRSSFLVDGTLHELGCARVPQKYLIAQLAVSDKHERHTVLTMTDGGSSYPVEVGLTMQQPTLVTPPISAPDGCFPKPQPVPAPTASPGI